MADPIVLRTSKNSIVYLMLLYAELYVDVMIPHTTIEQFISSIDM